MRKSSLRYDAGTEREALVAAMARWINAQGLDGRQAERIHRRITRLANVLKMPREQVFNEICRDAAELAATDLAN